MISLYKFLTIACFFTFTLGFAQNTEACPCCSPNYKAFDFWVGEWKVYNTDGGLVGQNNVIKMQDNCVIQENWVASNGKNTGTSYNFYDKNDNTWNQIWISNTGYVLKLKGNLNANNEMVLKSDLLTNNRGTYYNQITWTKNQDGSVTQLWQILNDKGEVLSNSFEGIYKKTD